MDHIDMESFEDELKDVVGVNQVYIVKHFPSIEDAGIRAKIQETGKLILKLRKAGVEIAEKLKETKLRLLKTDDISSVCWRTARYRRGSNHTIDWKVSQIETLKQALDELYINSKKPRPAKEEIDEQILRLQNQMNHGGMNVVKERKVVKQIKEANTEREIIIAEDAMKPPASSKYWGCRTMYRGNKIRWELKTVVESKQALEDRIKLETKEVKELRMKLVGYKARVRDLYEAKDALQNDVRIMERELQNIDLKKTKAFEYIWELKTRADEVNALHYEYVTLIKTAREVSNKKDVAALDELCSSQVEKHMREWNKKKAYREDYHKRMLSALKRRQSSDEDTHPNSIDEQVRLINSQR